MFKTFTDTKTYMSFDSSLRSNMDNNSLTIFKHSFILNLELYFFFYLGAADSFR